MAHGGRGKLLVAWNDAPDRTFPQVQALVGEFEDYMAAPAPPKAAVPVETGPLPRRPSPTRVNALTPLPHLHLGLRTGTDVPWYDPPVP